MVFNIEHAGIHYNDNGTPKVPKLPSMS